MRQRTNDDRSGAMPWCDQCWLRRLDLFVDFSPDELAFMRDFKIAHRLAPAGTALMREGEITAQLSTIHTGWAFRYKLLADGRRQIFNLLLPGDTVGIDAALGEPPHYGVEAATEVTYCALDAQRLPELLREHPGLALRLTGLALRERQFVDRRLTEAGRCTAEERIANFLLGVHARLAARGLARDHSFTCPLTQQQLADAVGLNVVHLNRTLRRLREAGLLTVRPREVTIRDMARLRALAPQRDVGDLARPGPLL